ncbi:MULTISPECIES: universal stress protein [unclassified Pseudonocardia]|uniref:universal stress protein n=1 Tax=unclassified Pseudonocardia TaxID=2619320 RepID=UPI00096333F2|nr:MULTISPECIES: universal stress protein [unclassified Pseudonocardia]MBN9098697.1 universal stress protein [Pseudonocardia sp.]OJY52074.1 MAG: hypothetical protein BGP03_08020 [Pseudonocardia sp. 73-21]
MAEQTQRSVLVGVDGSAAAARAALWATDEAVTTGRPLRLAVCVRPSMPELAGLALPPGTIDGAHLRATASGLLQSAVARCRVLAPGIDVQGELVSGRPVEMLDRLAQGAASLVLGASGQSGVATVLLGSSAAELARRVTAPLVVVRDLGAAGPDGPVVVGVDGSAVTGHVVRFAADHAAARGRELVAVHAWSDLPLDALAGTGAPGIDRVRARRDADALLESYLATARDRHPDLAVRRIVCLDRPARALFGAAAGASLLVVGRHGRAGDTVGPLGSVGHAVLHYAHCPVALVSGG